MKYNMIDFLKTAYEKMGDFQIDVHNLNLSENERSHLKYRLAKMNIASFEKASVLYIGWYSII